MDDPSQGGATSATALSALCFKGGCALVERTAEEIAALIAALTDFEKKVMLNVSIGWSVRAISEAWHKDYMLLTETVDSLIERVGVVDRLELAFFFVQYVLPQYTDQVHTEPGMLLRKLVAEAKALQEAVEPLHGSPRLQAVVEVLGSPKYAKYNHAQLAQQITEIAGSQVNVMQLRLMISMLNRAYKTPKSKIWPRIVAYLAKLP